MTCAIVEATRDRAAVARGVLTTLAITVSVVGLLVHQLGGVTAPVVQPPTVSGDGHRLVIPGDAYGECHVDGRVNGSLFRHMLIDSGASGHLTFGRNHAGQLGFDPARLSYSYSYDSANGIGHEAHVQVRELRLDDSFVLRDVPAAITAAPQTEVLLGIEIIRRLNLQFRDGNCILFLS